MNAPETETATAFFATLHGRRDLIDGNGVKVGVALPSAVHPGALLICLRTDLLDAMESARATVPPGESR